MTTLTLVIGKQNLYSLRLRVLFCLRYRGIRCPLCSGIQLEMKEKSASQALMPASPAKQQKALDPDQTLPFLP